MSDLDLHAMFLHRVPCSKSNVWIVYSRVCKSERGSIRQQAEGNVGMYCFSAYNTETVLFCSFHSWEGQVTPGNQERESPGDDQAAPVNSRAKWLCCGIKHSSSERPARALEGWTELQPYRAGCLIAPCCLVVPRGLVLTSNICSCSVTL